MAEKKTLLTRVWNTIRNREPSSNNGFMQDRFDYGPSYSYRPDRNLYTVGNDSSIITSIYNRIALDVCDVAFKHVKVDEEGYYKSDVSSVLQKRFDFDANMDQTAKAAMHDIVSSMLDEGVVCVVPTIVDRNPDDTDSYKIYAYRTGKILEWFPQHVKVRVYDDRDGERKDIIVPKSQVSIIENPFYAVMNGPNSTFQRLKRKLALLDSVDEKTTSGKMDIIIQLPYSLKSEGRQKVAQQRREDIEKQLFGSQYGIAYVDSTEKVIQLNRPVDNNLLTQIEYLTEQVYAQLGITKEIMNGSASEEVMTNYYARTISPIADAIADEFTIKFLSDTARAQGQRVLYFRNVFKLSSVQSMGDASNQFISNEVMSPNEIRVRIGIKPSDDPDASKLGNRHINTMLSEGEGAAPVDADVASILGDNIALSPQVQAMIEEGGSYDQV